MKKAIKIIKVLLLSLFALVLLILAAHAIGYFINNRTPKGGINESMYIDINGTKQWINIYGESKKIRFYSTCTADLAHQQVRLTTLSHANGLTSTLL